MNDIAKQATVDRFLLALQKEHLSKKETGICVGIAPSQVSYLFNKHYWDKLGDTGWERVLAWVNSGQSFKEYAEKHNKVLCEKSNTAKSNVPDEPILVLEKEKIVPDKKRNIPKNVEPESKPRLTNGQLIDLLLERKAELKAEVDAIDTLLKHYIS